ncbi:MAG TPA: DNA gyrase inhibitor YacG [Polyangiaceae bacterium]|nr:DNA gyrase inhibitor YacG [Polyangiaceae bacterium]
MKQRCPSCQQDFESSVCRPFCSPRCKRQDLANWLEGNYRLPRAIEPADLEELGSEEREELLAALTVGGPIN